MSCACQESVLYGCCNCCTEDCAIPEPTQGPQGVPGPIGPAGPASVDGINSFGNISIAGVMPPVGNTVVLNVDNGAWAITGQPIYVSGVGFFGVTTATSTTITAENLGAPGNVAPGDPIPLNSKVGPGGYEGALVSPLPVSQGGTGQATAIAAFNALSPLLATGDMLYYAGTNVRLPVGASGSILRLAGAFPTWANPVFSASAITSGQLAIAQGGTSASTPSAARTALDTPGLNSDNIFNGSQRTNLTGVQSFTVYDSGSLIVNIGSGSLPALSVAGTATLHWTIRNQEGQWKRAEVQYTTANASTYSVFNSGTAKVEIVVSTYSLTASQAITLPAGSDGRIVTIIDGGGNASTNNITVNRAGSDTILGATTYVINNNYGSVKFLYVATTTNWVICP